MKAASKEQWEAQVKKFHPNAIHCLKPTEQGGLMMRVGLKVVAYYNPHDGNYSIRAISGMQVE